MRDQKALVNRLEAMKELKSEYLVGSKAAYEYIRTMEWYESVLDQLNDCTPSLVKKFDLSKGMVAWLLNCLKSSIAHHWKRGVLEVSTPQQPSMAYNNSFVFLINESPLVRHPSSLDKEWHEWTSDYENHLQLFLRDRLATDDTDIGKGTVEELLNWVEERLHQGAIRLQDVRTGEVVSFQGMQAHCRYRNTTTTELGVHAKALLQYDTYREELYPQEVDDLTQALSSHNLEMIHEIVRQVRLRDYNKEQFIEDHMDKSESGLLLTEMWLYDHRLYERARHEQTLGTYEVERRIALNAIHTVKALYSADYPNDPKEQVEFVLEYHIFKIQEETDSIRDPEACSLISEESRRAYIEQLRYGYRSVHQNKRWLIKFLAH